MRITEFLKERKVVCEDTVLWVESALGDKNMTQYKNQLKEIREDLHRLWHNYDHILKEELKK